MKRLHSSVCLLAALPFLIAAALVGIVGQTVCLICRLSSNAACSFGCYLLGIQVPKDASEVKAAVSQRQ